MLETAGDIYITPGYNQLDNMVTISANEFRYRTLFMD